MLIVWRKKLAGETLVNLENNHYFAKVSPAKNFPLNNVIEILVTQISLFIYVAMVFDKNLLYQQYLHQHLLLLMPLQFA